MKTALCAAAIGVAMLTGYGLSAQPAKAGYVVDLTQQGANVVATGSGPIDLTGLTFDMSVLSDTLIFPDLGAIYTGITATADWYAGTTGPVNFGSGGFILPSSGSGDLVGFDSFIQELAVPHGYVSDSPLSDTSTYLSETLSSLGVTPGTYEWTWGTGANQNFTLEIAAIPEPSTWAMMLLGFAGLGLLGYRKTRSDNA